MLRLEPPKLSNCVLVAQWRADPEVRAQLRTERMLTERDQERFYERVVCNPDSPHRYYTIRHGDNIMVGFGGLTHISWANRHAEISLIINPLYRGKGHGRAAVKLLLDEAFNVLGLATVFGEVYQINERTLQFWLGQSDGFAMLPNRKQWNGKLHSSVVFWFLAP